LFKTVWQAAALLLFLSPSLFAAIEGTVLNQTTGKPQSGVSVTLTKLGPQGMAAAGSAQTNSAGQFRLESSAADAHLLQAVYKGVNYNLQLQAGVTSGIEIPVYEPAARAIDEVKQHMILVETDAQEMVVNETVIVENATRNTWFDPKRGTFRFWVPAAAGDNIRFRATAPGGMPVERKAQPAGQPGVWFVDYPVRPGGETRFDVSYKVPAKQPAVYEGRILHGAGPVRLVLPPGLKAEGEGLKSLGVEPSSQASIFDVAGKQMKFTLTGSGEMKQVQPTQPSEADGPRIERIEPPGYGRNKYLILGLMLAVLALAFTSHFLRGTVTGSKS
jgi:hypothetical protein